MVASARGPSSSSVGTAQHDLREIEGADDGRERDAEALPCLAAGSASRSAALRLRLPGMRCSSRGTASQVSRHPILPHAQVAPPEVGADHDVADLAGGEAAAVDEGAGDEQPGADTVADLDEHHVAGGVAEAVLGERRGVRVVRDDHRQPGARRAGVCCRSPRRPSRGSGR